MEGITTGKYGENAGRHLQMPIWMIYTEKHIESSYTMYRYHMYIKLFRNFQNTESSVFSS